MTDKLREIGERLAGGIIPRGASGIVLEAVAEMERLGEFGRIQAEAFEESNATHQTALDLLPESCDGLGLIAGVSLLVARMQELEKENERLTSILHEVANATSISRRIEDGTTVLHYTSEP